MQTPWYYSPLLLNRYNQMKNWHETSLTIAKKASAKGENLEMVYKETYNKLQASAKTKKSLILEILRSRVLHRKMPYSCTV